jgi:tetrapyrrole methylase family protein/MazG family protein
VLALDAEPDMRLLRKHYGDGFTLEMLAPGYAVLPPLGPFVDLASVAAVGRIAERLRAVDGCPWDREQTHQSLRPHLLEEAYETLEALDSGDLDRLRDELGDLLLQIALHAQIAHEEGAFDMADVARRIGEKLIRRHPHVFAGATVASSGELLAQWERIKREEREAGGRSEDGITSGVPKDLPALFAAERLQERAARVGVEPARIDMPLDIDDSDFLGELLFDLVAVAREKGFDAEAALREANERFVRRVARVEERARKEGKALESYAPEEMRRLWDESVVAPQAGDGA